MTERIYSRKLVRFDLCDRDTQELLGYLHGDGSIDSWSLTFCAGSTAELVWLLPKVRKVFGYEVPSCKLKGTDTHLLRVSRISVVNWLKLQRLS